jgi:hypothetical protein
MTDPTEGERVEATLMEHWRFNRKLYITHRQWAVLVDRYPNPPSSPTDVLMRGLVGDIMSTPVHKVDKQEESSMPWWTP